MQINTSEIIAPFHEAPQLTEDFGHECWRRSPHLMIDKNWRGEPAARELQTIARALWSPGEIIFGFECSFTELDIDEEFDAGQERYALWDRDVCEAFVRSPLEPHEKSYREFEIAPTGQWCDLIVDRSRMSHDWEWQSGMRVVSRIDQSEKVWRAAMAIPFAAFGCRPIAGDNWKANLYRISRLNGERQYLAFSPTLTEEPSFHVAESFVNLSFLD
jgi:hypothetical protein